MTSAPVLDLKGNKTHEITLNADIFSAPKSLGSMHTAVVRQLANARSGSANSKTRSEVRGGGAKPWRQKGTGRARAGSRRSPLWAGGGVSFGPKPRDFSISMPKKMRAHALKSALAARREELVVVNSFAEVTEPKTKLAAQIFRALKIDGKKVLLVLDYTTDTDKTITLAARNIEGTKVVHISNLSVKDLLNSEVILTTESTIETIGKRFQAEKSEAKPKRERTTKVNQASGAIRAKGDKSTSSTTAKSSKVEPAPKTEKVNAPEAKAAPQIKESTQAAESLPEKKATEEIKDKAKAVAKAEASETPPVKPAKKAKAVEAEPSAADEAPTSKSTKKTKVAEAQASDIEPAKASPKKTAKEESADTPPKPTKKAKKEE
jgi:large subunit ribosomal protein L4